MIIEHSHRRAGFTLAESMIALVLLGAAAAGVLLPFSKGAVVQAEGQQLTLAAQLADSLLEQIVATPTDQIVARWNAYTEVQGQVRDAAGVVFTDPLYARFSRSATCYNATVVQQTQGLSISFIFVSVRVCSAGRPVATLSRLISK